MRSDLNLGRNFLIVTQGTLLNFANISQSFIPADFAAIWSVKLDTQFFFNGSHLLIGPGSTRRVHKNLLLK